MLSRPESRLYWTKGDVLFALLQGAALLCMVLQWAISRDEDNLVSVTLVVLSSSLVFQYLWRSGSSWRYPVSSLALLGMTVTNQFAALVYQSLSWTPFIDFLRWPLTTFGVLAMVHAVAVLAHWIYTHLAATNSAAAWLSQHVLQTMKVMDTPRPLVIWMMAAVGLYAMATGGGTYTGDAGGKFVQAFSFLCYVPFLIPVFARQYPDSYCNWRVQAALLVAYTLGMIVLAIGLNARQIMAIGPVQVGLMALVYYWADQQAISWRTWRRLAWIIALLTVSIGLFSDLAVSMALVRDKKETLGKWQLVQETAQTLMDRVQLERYQESLLADAPYKVYEETYLNNPVVSRFSETKFHDNNIASAIEFTDAERAELWRFTVDKCLAILPQNVLDFLDIPINKDEVAFSLGDFYRYLGEGLDGTLGGFATGSIWAHVIGLMGLAWTPLALLLMFVPSFVLLDAATRRIPHIFVSPPVICSFWFVFIYGLAGESLVWKIGFYVRDLPQRLVLYALLYGAIRVILKLFGLKSQGTGSAFHNGQIPIAPEVPDVRKDGGQVAVAHTKPAAQ